MSPEEIERQVAVREAMSRRAIVSLREEDLLRLARLDSDYRVVGVFADNHLQTVCLVVTHPDIPITHRGVRLPDLTVESSIRRVVRVIEDPASGTPEVWERSELHVDAPVVISEQAREHHLAQLTGLCEDAGCSLDFLLRLLLEAAHSGGAPYNAIRFLEWLR